MGLGSEKVHKANHDFLFRSIEISSADKTHVLDEVEFHIERCEGKRCQFWIGNNRLGLFKCIRYIKTTQSYATRAAKLDILVISKNYSCMMLVFLNYFSEGGGPDQRTDDNALQTSSRGYV